MTKTFYELMDPDTTVGGTHPAITLTDGSDEVVYHQVYFPTLMTMMNSVKIFLISNASGDLSWGLESNWGRVCAGALADEGSDTIIQHQESITRDIITCIDITDAFTGVLAGSLGGIAFTRYGASVLDTIGADVYYLGLEVDVTP